MFHDSLHTAQILSKASGKTLLPKQMAACRNCRKVKAMTHPFDEIAVEAAAKAIYFEQHTIMHDHEKLWLEAKKNPVWRDCANVALSAALKSARDRGMAEICEDFMFSDDEEPHNFGNDEYYMPTVTIIRHKENEAK